MLSRHRLILLICALALSAMNARAQWVNRTPTPVLRAYSTVFMLDGRTGWIGGAYGSILKTTDGGGSWQLQYSTGSQFDNVSQIGFIDDSRGICLISVGFGNEILTTTDGGAAWNVDTSLYNLTADSMVSPTQFWIAGSGDSVLVGAFCWGYFGNPAESHIVLYHSTDFGVTWSRQNDFPAPNQYISRILYTTPLNGLVFGRDSIYATTDGGNSWKADSFSLTGDNLFAVAGFLNPDTGYFAGPANGGDINSPTLIGWTHDGGKTWSVDSTDSFTGFLVGGVVFASRERGFAVRSNFPAIYTTTDGGLNWTADTLSNNIPPQDIASADGRTVVAVGSGGEVLVSKDSGATWMDQTPPTKIQFSSVKYLSSDLVAAIGNVDGLFVSNDSGKTWTRHQMPSGLNVQFAFGDSSNCWICDDSSRIFHSTDLGLTWTFQNEQNIPAPPLYGISFLGDSTGCAVGAGGFITATSDGGNTWSLETSGTTHNLYGVFVASPWNAWAVGDGGTILASSGGLSTWSSQASPTTATLRSISFSDSLNGYILGDNGTILKTTDGGATWTPTASPANSLNAMKFTGPDTGWIAGDGGNIFNTSDGGANWTSQKSGSGANIFSLDFLNSKQGIAIGDSSVVLTTDNGGAYTGIRDPGGTLPTAFALYQNYPNPFNPSTTVRFDLKQPSTVTLEIYNTLGQRVKYWNYGMMNAGRYNENINMGQYASGVYFYRIAALGRDGEEFTSVKKLMLVK